MLEKTKMGWKGVNLEGTRNRIAGMGLKRSSQGTGSKRVKISNKLFHFLKLVSDFFSIRFSMIIFQDRRSFS